VVDDIKLLVCVYDSTNKWYMELKIIHIFAKKIIMRISYMKHSI